MNWDVTVKADVEWFRILTRCKLLGLISPWPSLVVPVVLFVDAQIPKTYWWVLELKVIWRAILIKIRTGTDNLDAKSQYCLTRARIQASLRRILSLITHKTVNVRHIKKKNHVYSYLLKNAALLTNVYHRASSFRMTGHRQQLWTSSNDSAMFGTLWQPGPWFGCKKKNKKTTTTHETPCNEPIYVQIGCLKNDVQGILISAVTEPRQFG